ncbi:MAG: hypothetical protein L3K15_06265 [Thermoplasmata archaeon]|nr:hypothetical protein [Thermoplasmata archaeon]
MGKHPRRVIVPVTALLRAPTTWRTCAYCGDAFLPGGLACPTCGAKEFVTAEQLPQLPRRARMRFRFVRSFRMAIVVAAIVGVSYVLVSAVWTGPPAYADPLTTRASYAIPAGGFAYVSGAVTGEDYIVGNYSVVTPAAAQVGFAVYNTSEFIHFVHGGAAAAQWHVTPVSSGRIVWAAPYTDTYFLVWQNPNSAGSHVDLTVYATTNYMSNVVIG